MIEIEKVEKSRGPPGLDEILMEELFFSLKRAKLRPRIEQKNIIGRKKLIKNLFFD
jgi:hypothetical protein